MVSSTVREHTEHHTAVFHIISIHLPLHHNTHPPTSPTHLHYVSSAMSVQHIPPPHHPFRPFIIRRNKSSTNSSSHFIRYSGMGCRGTQCRECYHRHYHTNN